MQQTKDDKINKEESNMMTSFVIEGSKNGWQLVTYAALLFSQVK